MFGSLSRGYWLLFGLVGFTITLAATVGQRPFLTYFSPIGLSEMAPIWFLPLLIWLAALTVRLIARKNAQPLRTMKRMLSRHRYWLGRGLLFTFLAFPLGRAIMAFKSAIPNQTSYWADPLFVEMDRFIFFGADGWQVTHAVFGPTATMVLDRVYLLWFMVLMGFIAWINFTRDQELQLRGLLSWLLSWLLLGMFAAMGLASVGPCYYDAFYGGDTFAGLDQALRSHGDVKALRTMDYLYENRGNEALGNGISAMPSLHVAMAFLLVIALYHQTGKSLGTVLAAVFALFILVGSVHLGWHYLVDGLASMAGVAVIWWLSGRIVRSCKVELPTRQSLAPAG